jgi:hypothetical protein
VHHQGYDEYVFFHGRQRRVETLFVVVLRKTGEFARLEDYEIEQVQRTKEK